MYYKISTIALSAALIGLSAEAHASPQLHLQLDQAPGITLSRGETWLETVSFHGCGASWTVVQVQAPVDLKTGWSVNDPADGSCQISLNFGSDVLLEGTEGNQGFLSLSPLRSLDFILGSGQTMTVGLPGTTRTLEGVYGGNPDLVVDRDTAN